MMKNTEQEGSKLPGHQGALGVVPPAPGLTGTVSEKKRKTRMQATVIQSVSQLLQATYAGTFKRTTLHKRELDKMRDAPALSETQRGELVSQSLPDRALSRTRQLMLIGIGLDAPAVAGQIMDFAREVLQHHPAFGSKLLAGALGNLPEAPTEDKSVEALSSQNFASLTWSDGKKPLNKRELEQCKVNAVHCLLLLFRSMRGTSVEGIQQHLQTGLWAPVARRHKTEAQKLRVLVTTRDTAAASITHGLLERQVVEQSQRAEAARRSQERTAARAVKLEEQLAGLDKKLAATHAEVGRLASELREAMQAHENYKAQAKDEFEQLRGQVLRCLNAELSLLDDGLHALQRDPPRVHVMLDHAERAIDGLKREVERLRERT